jgi:hypothetical protein
MKLRIVQDHDTSAQPWYRLEQYIAAADHWHIVTSGPDLVYIRARLEKMATRGSLVHEVTVIEEREV